MRCAVYQENNSLPTAYMSETGHAFCPVCVRTLLKFEQVAPHDAICARCDTLIHAELETAHYTRSSPHTHQDVFARLRRGRGGVIAAALGVSLSLAACKEPVTPEPPPLLGTDMHAASEHDAGEAPDALTPDTSAPDAGAEQDDGEDLSDMSESEDAGDELDSSNIKKPVAKKPLPTSEIVETDERPFNRDVKIYGAPPMFDPPGGKTPRIDSPEPPPSPSKP